MFQLIFTLGCETVVGWAGDFSLGDLRTSLGEVPLQPGEYIIYVG